MFPPGIENQWDVAFHPDFAAEVLEVSVAVRSEIYSLVGLLRRFGPQLGGPQADTLKGSRHTNMEELRFRADKGVWRVAFAFDAKRRAILLVGGDKGRVSKGKFYRHLIEVADRRFDQHQRAMESVKEKQ